MSAADAVAMRTQSMVNLLSRNWWTLVLRGSVAILLGLAALGWPQITLEILVILLGAYMLVDGAFALFAAVKDRSQHRRWWFLLVEGLAGVVAGLIALFFPAITALALIYLLAAWALVTGILEILAAITLRQELHGEWLLVLAGVASILLAVIAALRPAAGMIALAWIIGIYAIVFGLALITLGIRLRSWASRQ
jgi:uncharacterized membrane protein HdeD (DUF308 family)